MYFYKYEFDVIKSFVNLYSGTARKRLNRDLFVVCVLTFGSLN